MTRIIYKLFERLAYKIYVHGKRKFEKEQHANYLLTIKEKAIIDQTTLLFHDAVIQNEQHKAEKILVGKECRVRGHLMVFRHGGEVTIGDHCYIGEGTKIWSAKKIQIGNRVLIAHNVNVHDNVSHPLNSELRHKDYVHIFNIGLQENIDLREKEVIIEDDVWIGFNSTIMKGVTIGKGSIIGSNTVITKDVPPYTVMVGNPPRILKNAD